MTSQLDRKGVVGLAALAIGATLVFGAGYLVGDAGDRKTKTVDPITDPNPPTQPMPGWQPQPQPTTEPQPKRPRRWPWIVGIIAAFFIGTLIGAAGGSDSTDSTAATPEATVTATKTQTVKVTPKPKAAITEDGTYHVGTEIKPGTYRANGSGSECYWARLSSSNESDIISNHVGSAHTFVTIKSSDKAFETSGCGDWTR
jgi:hypothetical protein